MFRHSLLALLALLLSACGDDKHIKLRYADLGPLPEGAPVVMDEQVVGKVAAIESDAKGEHLVEVTLQGEGGKNVKAGAEFYLADDPSDPNRQRIEVSPGDPNAAPLREGEEIRGRYKNALGLPPFGALLKGLGDVLRDLRGQAESFGKEFEGAPDSPETRSLKEEWRKLREELGKADSAAQGAIERELAPRLREQMETLRKKLEQLRAAPSGKADSKPSY